MKQTFDLWCRRHFASCNSSALAESEWNYNEHPGDDSKAALDQTKAANYTVRWINGQELPEVVMQRTIAHWDNPEYKGFFKRLVRAMKINNRKGIEDER